MTMLSALGTAAVQWTSDPPAAGDAAVEGLAAAEARELGDAEAVLDADAGALGDTVVADDELPHAVTRISTARSERLMVTQP
jgi:hypothetical protein